MANRHKAKKNVGGAVPYNAQGSNVLKEARQTKATGGKVVSMSGGKSAARRARGGGVGADRNPYSSAKC